MRVPPDVSIRTPQKEEEFLNELRGGNSVAAGCDAAGIGRRTAYDWRRDDPDFAQRWDEALEEGADRMEDAATNRALQMSDTLLIFMLKSRRPDKYREPKVVVPVERPEEFDLANLTDEEVAQFRALRDKCRLTR
jgi:hypothetical protein